MPAPSNSPGLTLGPPLVDMSSFDPRDPDQVRQAIENLYMAMVAQGWVAAARRSSDVQYQNVVWRDGKFWGGKPSDPTNPDELFDTAGGGGGSLAPGTYIDITSDTIHVDLTEVAGYDSGANQYLKNEGGTIKWVTVSICEGS